MIVQNFLDPSIFTSLLIHLFLFCIVTILLLCILVFLAFWLLHQLCLTIISLGFDIIFIISTDRLQFFIIFIPFL